MRPRQASLRCRHDRLDGNSGEICGILPAARVIDRAAIRKRDVIGSKRAIADGVGGPVNSDDWRAHGGRQVQRTGITADDPQLGALLTEEEKQRYNYPNLRVIPPGGLPKRLSSRK